MAREIVPKRKIRYPMGLERDYAKLLTAYVARKMRVVAAFIPEMKTALQSSNTTGHINLVIDQIGQAMESADVLTGTMQKMARLVETHTEKETDAEFRSVFSLSVPLLPGPLKSQPVTDVGRQDAASPDLEELKRAWVDQNLDLIRSIDGETLARIKQRLNDAIIYNSNAAELTRFLTEAIQDIAHNETNRAVLIATDQIGKLHGRMSQYRQEQAGITHYIWETAHDSRVRPWHRTRQGKKFAWSAPPPDGHPGIPIRCRCVALPVIDIDTIPIRTKAGTFISLAAKKLTSAPPQGEKEGNANNLYPKTLGGASRGEEMTHAEADSGNVNPRVNFSEAYRNNCQTCVVDYEARRRGYDVIAKGFEAGGTTERLSRKTNLAWLDPETGEAPAYILDKAVHTPKQLASWLHRTLDPKGRYTIEFAWKGRGSIGHIVCVSQDKAGNLVMYDPQLDRTYTGDKEIQRYFKRVRFKRTFYGITVYTPPRLLRVDDKAFNVKIVNDVLEKRKK